jgi:hypothetical protein
VCAWPIAFLVCSGVQQLRPGLRYLGVYAGSAAAAFVIVQLTPSSFLYWWWD